MDAGAIDEGAPWALKNLVAAKRFGPLGEATRARLQAAGSEQIETWAERILDAHRLDEVFGDE